MNYVLICDNLSGAGWDLTPDQMARLDAASQPSEVYPYNFIRKGQRS